VKRIQLADRGLGVFDIGEEPVRVMFRSPATFGSAACCVEWLRFSEPIPYSLVVGDEAAPPPAVAAPHRRRSLRKRENELRVRPERRRSCEIIEFRVFRSRVFSYLRAKKSDFFNNFTASEPFRTAGRRSRKGSVAAARPRRATCSVVSPGAVPSARKAPSPPRNSCR